MRLLAVDLGDKRTGLASGDTETGTVFPIETLHVPRGDALLQAVELLEERSVEIDSGSPLASLLTEVEVEAEDDDDQEEADDE